MANRRPPGPLPGALRGVDFPGPCNVGNVYAAENHCMTQCYWMWKSTVMFSVPLKYKGTQLLNSKDLSFSDPAIGTNKRFILTALFVPVARDGLAIEMPHSPPEQALIAALNWHRAALG